MLIRLPQITSIFKDNFAEWILAPNSEAGNPNRYCMARHHGDFDDDEATLKATLARILGAEKTDVKFEFKRSSSALRSRRMKL